MELIKDYDCIIDYHPGKANVVADALSRKFVQTLRALNAHLSLKDVDHFFVYRSNFFYCYQRTIT